MSAPSLAEILAALKSGTSLPKATAAPRKAAAKAFPAKPLSVGKAYALKRTGYTVWKALGRLVEIQPQVCACCGTTVEAVKGEYYKLANGTAHAIWLRPEGYEIEAQADLPIEFVWVEPRTVSACASCARSEANLLFILDAARKQLEMPF